MKRFGRWTLLFVGVVFVGLIHAATGSWVSGFLLPRADADELADEHARAIEALHPFGVRGLPDAFKGSAAAEARPAAVNLALEWLAAHQAPDGSWQPAELSWCNGKKLAKGQAPEGKGKSLYGVGVTGMVVAAYLGAGYTHRGKHPFAKVVRRALTWLVKVQDPEGCFGPRSTQQYIYNHAFGTLALVEAYALTGDPKLQGPAQKAIDFSAYARNPGMAWRYGIKPGDNDTSITGCMGMPLYIVLRLNRAGARADMLEPLGLDDTVFTGMRTWIDRIVDPDWGRAGYVQRGTGPARPQELVDEFPGEKSEACTAITVLMRLLLPAWDDTKEMHKASQEMIDKGVKLMLGLPPIWAPGQGTIDLYYWYYATMAMRQVGGKAWKAWDDALATALLNSQHRSGDVCGVRGSWEPEGVWAKGDGGRIYATALCLLMLETPERMHPLPEDRSDLLAALQTKGLPVARLPAILRGLGLLHVPKAGAAVVDYMGHADGEVCAAAAEALGHLDAGSHGVRLLGRLLDDKRVVVRRAAVRALASQGAHLTPLLDALTARLGDDDAAVAAGAARALGASAAAAAVPALTPRLEGGDIALRVASAAALHRLRSDAAVALPAGVMAALVVGLGTEGPARVGVRVEAARTLEAMAPDIVAAKKALVDGLVDPSPRVRIHAAGALLAIGSMRASCQAAWISALEALDGRDRLLAMERLTAAPTPKATLALTKQLLTGPTTLRIKAAEALRAIGPGARSAAASLSWTAVNGALPLRRAARRAYEALAMDPAAARTVLLPVFSAQPPDARLLEGAARALVLQGEAIVGTLAGTLGTTKALPQAWTLEVLRRLGPKAAAAVPAVVKVLEGAKDPKVSRSAIRVLGAIGPAASSALPALKARLQDKQQRVRVEALWALGGLAAGSDAALDVLLEITGDDAKERRALRLAAIQALGTLKRRGSASVPRLLGTLQDGDSSVRNAAIKALGDLWPASEPYMLSAVGESQARIRNGVAQVVLRIGEPAKKFVKPLAKVLARGTFAQRSVYGSALAAIGKPAVRAVTKLLRHDTPKVRGEAARVLGEIGPPAKRALGSLKRLLSDPDFQVRFRAEEAIKQIKPPPKKKRRKKK